MIEFDVALSVTMNRLNRTLNIAPPLETKVKGGLLASFNSQGHIGTGPQRD